MPRENSSPEHLNYLSILQFSFLFRCTLLKVTTHRFEPVHIPDEESNVEKRHEGVKELKLQVKDNQTSHYYWIGMRRKLPPWACCASIKVY